MLRSDVLYTAKMLFLCNPAQVKKIVEFTLMELYIHSLKKIKQSFSTKYTILYNSYYVHFSTKKAFFANNVQMSKVHLLQKSHS